MARLLDSLREAGAEEQAAALAERAAAHVSLDDPGAVAWLLDSLREAGAEEQAAALLRRDPAAHVSLDDPGAVAWLLDSLREAGARAAGRRAGRARRRPRLPRRPAHAVGRRADLDMLRQVGAEEQAAALAERLPGAGMFEVFREQEDRQDRFRFGREADGSPAEPWAWEDLDLRGRRSQSVRRPPAGHAKTSPCGLHSLRKCCLAKPVRSRVR